MKLVLSKLDSNTTLARPLVLRKRAVPPYTEAVTALYYWRFEDEPTSEYQYLGQQTVGFPFVTPFEGSGREIRISMIGKASNGAQSTYDPREGVQTTVYVPSAADLILTDDGELLTDDGEILEDLY